MLTLNTFASQPQRQRKQEQNKQTKQQNLPGYFQGTRKWEQRNGRTWQLSYSDRTENMAAEDQTGHGGPEGTMAADHIAVTELERTHGPVRNTYSERQEKHRTL